MPDSTPQGSVDSKHTQSQDSYSAAVEKRAQKGQAAEGKKGSTKDGKSTKSHAVELNYRRGEEENPSIDYQHTSQSDSAKVGRRDDAPRSQTTDSSSESSVPAQERPMEVQASRRGLSVSGDQDNTNVEATRPDDQQTDDAATGDDTTNEQGPADEQDAAPAEGEAASATRRSIKNDHGRVTIANAGNGGNAKSGNGGNASGGASNQRNAAVAQSKTNNQGGSKKSSPKKYYGGKQNYGSGSLIDLDLDLLCSS